MKIAWLTPDRFDLKPDKSSWLEIAKCLKDRGWLVTILVGTSRNTNINDYKHVVEALGGL